MRAVLNAKIYVGGDARDRALRSFGSLAENEIGDLDVGYEVDVRRDDRVEVRGTGPDVEAAFNRLGEVFGTMETDPVEGESYVGTLESWDDDGFVVDIGRDARVTELGLGPGSPSQARERFGIVQHTPLEVVWDDQPRLSDSTLDELWGWRDGNDRVNVNSSTRAEVRATVNRAGHAHDVVTVERLGLLEQSVVCADGTDAPGLVSSIGEYVRGEMKCVVT